MAIFKENTKPTTLQITVPDENTPFIYLTTEVLMKMNNYIQNTDKEISWLGSVERENNIFTIVDVMLFQQDVTGVTTELDEGGLSAFASHLMQTNQIELYNSIRMWGHSHVSLPINPSGTDNDTFKQFYESCEYFIRLIANKKGEIKIDFIDNDRHIKYLDMDWYELKSERQIELEKLISEFNNEMEDLNAVIKESALVEIEANIIKKKESTRKTVTTTDGGNTGTTKDTKVKKNEIEQPTMIKYTEGGVIIFTAISSIFTDGEITDIVEECKEYYDLYRHPDILSKDEFANYNQDEFRELYSKLVSYYYQWIWKYDKEKTV